MGLEPPLQVDQLCARLGERRGRPIRLVPRPMPATGPSGLWVATAERDYILYQRDTTDMHQDHIVLHEIGHILAGHGNDAGDDTVDQEQWSSALPDLSPAMVRRALGRTCYDAHRERDAEMIATMIMGWVGPTTPIPGTDELSRLSELLGATARWR